MSARHPGPGAMMGVSQIQAVSYPAGSGGGRGDHRRSSRRRACKSGTTDEVPLDANECARAWQMLSHEYVRMCTNEIDQHLKSGKGVIVRQGSELRTPTALFNTFLQRDMSPFGHDARNAILAIGVVPIAFRRPQVAGLGIDAVAPFVPAVGTYTITTWAECGVQRFRFYWSAARAGTDGYGISAHFGEPDDLVLVAHNFGFNPTLDGRLTSNFNTLASPLLFAIEMQQLALRAERIRAAPPMVTAFNHAAHESLLRQDSGSGGRDGFFVGDIDQCERLEELMYERNAREQAAFEDEMRTWESCTGLDAQTDFNVRFRRGRDAAHSPVPRRARDWRGHEMPWSRQHYIGPSRTLVNAQLPTPRADLEKLNQQTMSVVCGVLNVPRGLLAADSHVRAGVEVVNAAMFRTVNRWADVLGNLMTGVYNHTLGIADLRDELRARAERRRRSPLDRADQLLSERDLFEAERHTRVHLTYDLPLSIPEERLDRLYERGVISWSTYTSNLLRLSNLARDQLANSEDPLSHADRLVLLLGHNATRPRDSGAAQTPSNATPNAPRRETPGARDTEQGDPKRQRRK